MTIPESVYTHLINDPPYKTTDGNYRMVVEIPSGTNEKWQTDVTTGLQYHDQENGMPRIIRFLAYPFNYGCVPQTVLSRSRGGDGDPVDAIILSPAKPRGSVYTMRVIGAIDFEERGERDTKMIGVIEGEPFSDIDSIHELLFKYPSAMAIVRDWFEGYKGQGKFLFKQYLEKDEAIQLIEEAHQDWQNEVKPGV